MAIIVESYGDRGYTAIPKEVKKKVEKKVEVLEDSGDEVKAGMVEGTCSFCGDAFWYYPQRFCSSNCRVKDFRKKK